MEAHQRLDADERAARVRDLRAAMVSGEDFEGYLRALEPKDSDGS